MLPNCRIQHAETILLNHFKPSAIGVTARLNQLQNASRVSIPQLIVWCCALRKEGERRVGGIVKEGDLVMLYITLKVSASCAQCAFNIKVMERFQCLHGKYVFPMHLKHLNRCFENRKVLILTMGLNVRHFIFTCSQKYSQSVATEYSLLKKEQNALNTFLKDTNLVNQ